MGESGEEWGLERKTFDKVVCYFINDKATHSHRHGITDVKTNLVLSKIFKKSLVRRGRGRGPLDKVDGN